MGFKGENEITVKVQCSEDELKRILTNDKFVLNNEYYAKDIFMIPKDIDIFKVTTRESLSKSIILREFQGISGDKHKMKITFKHKKINEKGEILKQDAINCEVLNIQDAKNIFDCIGYKEIMTIKEKHFSYYKGDFKIIVKILPENNILIEAETNKKYRTVEKLKKEINNTNIPFDNSNYFVKKAEEELEKIKTKSYIKDYENSEKALKKQKKVL